MNRQIDSNSIMSQQAEPFVKNNSWLATMDETFDRFNEVFEDVWYCRSLG
jgi:hypothetical protein